MNNSPLTLGVLIRFANSESTLPAVLAALQRQTRQPDVILGVANNSTDSSRSLMQSAGAQVIEWTERYDHSRVLNFGLSHLRADLVLVLSSHTVLESPDAIEQMMTCFDDERTACVSAKWDSDPYYSNAITFDELELKGLRFGSIYSNSMGMIRRSLWERCPFDDTLPTAEDFAWALAQLANGKTCHRLDFKFSYQRSGTSREGDFARVVFRLAKRYRLRVAWLGVRASLTKLLSPGIGEDSQAIKQRLLAWCTAVMRI